MDIRTERAVDIDAISAVIAAAFRNAPHSMQTEAAIVKALRRAGALTLSLIAEQGGDILGHVAFSPVRIDGESGRWFGLGPVSVMPGEQRRGIGSALIRRGLERLRERDAEGCVVLGDPAYYRRFGFRSDPSLRYAGAPSEYLQWLSFTHRQPTGEIIYHAGFDARNDD